MNPKEFHTTYETLLEQVHPDDRKLATSFVERAYRDHLPFAFEHRITLPNGEEKKLLSRGKVLCDGANKPIKMIGTEQDITESKQAEELRSRLAAIVECSDDAIIGTTLDGTINSWNPGAEKLYGYAADEIIGKSVETLSLPENRLETEQNFEKVKRGERVHYEARRARKDGTRIDVLLTVSSVRDSAGRVIGMPQ